MTELAKSDLFFFISSLSVIILTIIIAVLLVYVVLTVRDIKSIVDRIKEEGGDILEDIKELRLKLKEAKGLGNLAAIAAFFGNTFFSKRKRSSRKSKRKSEEEA
jgi:predicted Holliday junction resolvase-like endonuclease